MPLFVFRQLGIAIAVHGIADAGPKLEFHTLCSLCGALLAERTVDVSTPGFNPVVGTQLFMEDEPAVLEHMRRHGIGWAGG